MELLYSLWNVVVALGSVVVELVQFLAPWTPLIAWVAFWLLAVNWKQLYPVLMRGGIVGVIFTGLLTATIWSVVAPPADGMHHLYGLHVSNWTGKVVYVTGLFFIAAMCGNVQLTGCCGKLCKFEESKPEEGVAAH